MNEAIIRAIFAANFGRYIDYVGHGGRPRRLQASTAKAILLAYAHHADSDGQASLSLSLLSRETGLSRRAVINAVHALVQTGLLVPRGKSDDGTGKYAINLDALTRCAQRGG